MNYLPSLLNAAPGNSTAVIIPETGTAVTYEQLRRQVTGMAEALAGMGVRRGERVANVLPNGLPTIVAFLAGSIAGTAAPLNPAYRFEEFCFYRKIPPPRCCWRRRKARKTRGGRPGI